MTNLEWVTHQGNAVHAVETGLFGERAKKATPEIVESIRAEYVPYDREHGTIALGKKYGIDPAYVWRIINGQKRKRRTNDGRGCADGDREEGGDGKMNNKMKQITDLTIALLCATRDEVAILLREIDRHGVQAQCDAAIEKFAALTQALIKIRRCGNDFVAERAALETVIEEIAEAEIEIQMLKLIFGSRDVNRVRVKTMRRMETEVEEVPIAVTKRRFGE